MSTIVSSFIKDRASAKQTETERMVECVPKAWVNGNGTSVPASIINSFGVSSLTDAGVGSYTVNYPAPFSLTTYPCTGSNSMWHTIAAPSSTTTSIVRCYDATHVYIDSGWFCGLTAGMLA